MKESPEWMEPRLHRACWNAVSYFFSSWWTAIEVHAPWHEWRKRREGRGYLEEPWWVWPLAIFVSGPAFGFVQGYGCWFFCRPGWPHWPMHVAHAIESVCDRLERRYSTEWVWLPPDSGRPNEIGFHAKASAVTYGARDPETFVRPILKRPRCFEYVAPEMAASGTYGAGRTIMYEFSA